MKMHKKWGVAISIILILVACSVYLGWLIAKSDKQTFNDLTIEELEKLPKDERDKLVQTQSYNDVLMKLVPDKIKNNKNHKKIIKELITFELGKTLYELKFYNQLPTGQETEEFIKAVKLFQASIGHKETGIITFEEANIIIKNERGISFQKILLSGDPENIYRYKSKDKNTARVSGTWTLERENIAFPINTVEIECTKESGLCREVKATLNDFDSKTYLWLFSSSYNITKWDDHEIMAESYTECKALTLTINSDLKEVYLVEKNYEKKECNWGSVKLPSIKKPRISKLVDGYDLAKKYYDQKEKDNLKLYSPAYQKIVNEMAEKEKELQE
jgi:hypothetical protein